MIEEARTDVQINDNMALEAAREFAAAVAETAEYRAFDEAQVQLGRDATAQEAIHAYQEKRQALVWQLQLGAVADAEGEDLQRLEQTMLALPAVRAFVEAQGRLGQLCREIDGVVSEAIGLSFAAGCGPGCACG